jgi:hypothetical protein
MFKKIVICLSMVLFFTSLAFAKVDQTGYGSVLDMNNGNVGQILVNTGDDNGNADIGKWTDASFLKGDVGETGAIGPQGISGADGYTPIKNVDYFDGQNGTSGTNGLDGKTPIKGIDYNDGISGIDGKNGKDVDPAVVNDLTNKINSNTSNINSLNNRVNQLEETQYIIGGEVRVYDSKKWQVKTFVDYTTTRQTVDRIGVRFTYKIGQSFEEKELSKLNARLNKLEGIKNQQQREDNTEFYTTNNGIGVKEKF